MGGFSFRGYCGQRAETGPSTAPAALSECAPRLASPVGTAQDTEDNVWIADAGHNRLLVVDDTVERLLGVVGGAGEAACSLDLPLRLAHHPTESAMYVTDAGSGRVQRLAYEYDGERPRITGVDTFAADGEFAPNGVAAHEYRDGVRVIVADEFYREGSDLRGRIVVFDESGSELRSFRAVGEEHPTPLYWPQGLDTDDEGWIYVANTGHGVLGEHVGTPEKLATVLRCDRTGAPAPFAGRSDEVLAELPMPRDVAVVGSGVDAQIFVPDAATGRVHVFTSVGIADGVVPEDGEDLRTCAGLEDGVGIPRDGDLAARPGGDPTEQARFRGPVGISAFEGVSVPDSDADDPTLPVLVSEALAGRVGAYAVDVHRETARRFAVVGAPRDRSSQFSVPTGSTVVGDPDSPLAGYALVADGENGRLQTIDLAAEGAGERRAATPVALPATRFPFGLAYWSAGAAGGRLFVTDYTARYREDGRGQVHVYAVDECDDGPADLTLVERFAPWGLGEDEVKLPRGVAVDPLDDGRARAYVADSGNCRVGVWTYDWVRDTATSVGDRGGLGHYEGGFWNPSDVAVGERGLYVADENNNRLQRFDGETWHAVGSPGYGRGHEFLLPISVAARDGHLFVLDLVTRGIEVFAEDPDAEGGLRPVDSLRSFGGDAAAGELWLPYLLSVGEVSGSGVDVVVPDSTLHVAQHYTWSGE